MMKAVQCHDCTGLDALSLEEIDSPVPGTGQVQIQVSATGVNFPDLLLVQGKYQTRVEPPFIPCIECSGVISAIGDGVSNLQVGDRVVTMMQAGALAEFCVVDQSQVLPIPDVLPIAQAAGFAVTHGTMMHAYRDNACLTEKDTVLIMGASGGIGVAAVRLARAMGAEVIAAASSDAKLSYALNAGANHVINYSRESLRERVSELTNSVGVSVVVDPVGGSMALDAIKSMAWGGRYLVIGFADGEIPAIPANLLLLREATVHGVWWGVWSARNPDRSSENFRLMAEWVAQGKLKIDAPQVWPLDQFRQAFDAIASRQALGKNIIIVNPDL